MSGLFATQTHSILQGSLPLGSFCLVTLHYKTNQDFKKYMSVENYNIIDAISINPNNLVVLLISDHLEWDEQNDHLLILENKINSYLQFIESGQIYESYPLSKDKKIQISIACKYPPNDAAVEFLNQVTLILSESGYGLFHYCLQ